MENEPVAKAKGDPQVAVYTADGVLVGTVDQKDLSPIAAPKAPEGGDAQAPADADDTADDSDDSDDSSEVAPEPTPAPDNADAADDTAAPADAEPVAKSIALEDVESIVKKALEAVTEDHEAVVKSLNERIATLEAQPMPGGPLLGGASGINVRGQAKESASPELEEVRKQLATETDAARAEQLRRQETFFMLRDAVGR